MNDGALEFAERVITLIESGRRTATYKLATLQAIIDVIAAQTGPDGHPPDHLRGREVAARVIEIYWPQTMPYIARPDGAPTAAALRQSGMKNDIPLKLARYRHAHGLLGRCSVDEARAAAPVEWDRLVRELTGTVIGMPLAKLQRFGDGGGVTEDRFLYDFAWPDEVKAVSVDRPTFDDRMVLKPGVGEYLVRLAPLIRPLIEAKWAELVVRSNDDVLGDQRRLVEFLFGATRVSLDPVRGPLTELQGNECFYCASRLGARADVDHFIPWSRFADNGLDNLVAAHPACNSAKSASIAAVPHLEHWLRRAELQQAELASLANAVGWRQESGRTRGLVNASYLWLPAGAPLWLESRTYQDADQSAIRTVLAA